MFPRAKVYSACCAALFAPALSAAETPDQVLAQLYAQQGPLEGLYQVVVNGRAFERSVVVYEEGRALYLSAATLNALRIVQVEGPSIDRSGERWYRIDGLVGVSAVVDRARLQIVLQVDPQRLAANALDLQRIPTVVPQLPPPGVFLNYELLGTAQEGSSSFSGSVELAAFGAFGFANSTWTRSIDGGNGIVRLDSALRRDDPDRGLTLQVGDSISRSPSWGRSVRYAGLSYGTNPAVRPWLVTTPLVALSGTAAIPSTLDIYVNQQLIESRPVQPGPFSITGVPSVTGGGTVSVVTRDALGREQVVSQSFYTGRSLFREGYSEFGIDVGSIRQSYGLRSADYGSPTVALNWRGGLTNAWTVGGYVHSLQGVRVAGGDTTFGAIGLGQVTLIAAASDSEAGTGGLVGAAYERNDARRFVSFVVDYSQASDRFRLPGDAAGTSTTRRQFLASIGSQPFNRVGLSLSYLRRELQTAPASAGGTTARPEVETVAATASTQLVGRASLVATWSQQRRPVSSDTIFVSVLIPTDRPSGTASVGATRGSNDEWVGTAGFQTQFPPGPGIGYRAYAQTDGLVQLGALWNTNIAAVNAEVARTSEGTNGARASVSGAVGWAAGGSFLARPLTDGFALVDVGDVEGVRVFRDNSFVGQTNSSGRAVVPTLTAYSDNRLRIEPRDVPLDVRLGGVDATVAPYYRSPVVHSFVAKREQAASFIAVRRGPGGDVLLPLGTVLTGAPQPLLVGHDGIVYIADLTGPLQLRAKANGVPACRIDVPAPSTRSPLLDLGPLPCQEETK